MILCTSPLVIISKYIAIEGYSHLYQLMQFAMQLMEFDLHVINAICMQLIQFAMKSMHFAYNLCDLHAINVICANYIIIIAICIWVLGHAA